MKRVSFEIAKALKKAGYPQENCDEYLNKYGAVDGYLGHNTARPTYLEAWLWLWREKKFAIPADYFGYGNNYWSSCVPIDNERFKFFEPLKDPEEVIIAAIEYLCNNDLIK